MHLSFDEVPRRLSDQLAEHLRHEIYAGNLVPGQRLLEVELCRKLKVSRAPLREAILSLRTDGLVEVRPHRGAVVVEFSDEDIREVFALRRMLDPVAAAAAAERGDPLAAAALERALEEIRIALSRADMLATAIAHVDFHRTVGRLSGMPRLRAFIDALCTHVLASHGIGYQMLGAEDLALLEDHQPIAEAIIAGDAAAAERLMREHFRPVDPMIASYRRLRGKERPPAWKSANSSQTP